MKFLPIEIEYDHGEWVMVLNGDTSGMCVSSSDDTWFAASFLSASGPAKFVIYRRGNDESATFLTAQPDFLMAIDNNGTAAMVEAGFGSESRLRVFRADGQGLPPQVFRSPLADLRIGEGKVVFSVDETEREVSLEGTYQESGRMILVRDVGYETRNSRPQPLPTKKSESKRAIIGAIIIVGGLFLMIWIATSAP